MLEAKIPRAELLKKILDAIKELVTDANWDCSEEGMKLQAMDNSHIALVSLDLKTEAFEDGFRCDRNMSLGMNLTSLQKIIKCASNDDEVTLRAADDSDALSLTFQNRRADRMGEYEMKLMDIDQEHLSIPDTQYDATITMPSTEFLRIVRDIKELGESVKIEVTKEGIKFSSEGDIGSAAVTLRPTGATKSKAKPVESDAESDEEGDEDEDEEEAEEGDNQADQEEDNAMDEDDQADEVDDVKPDIKKKKAIAVSDDEDEDKPEIMEIEDDDSESPKKRKRSESEVTDVKPDVNGEKTNGKPNTPKKKAKQEPKAKAPAKKKGTAITTNGKAKGKGKAKKDEEEDREIKITLNQSVALTFSIKYLINFAKSTPLSDKVSLNMSNEVPLLVEYAFEGGFIRFYLAPKISED